MENRRINVGKMVSPPLISLKTGLTRPKISALVGQRRFYMNGRKYKLAAQASGLAMSHSCIHRKLALTNLASSEVSHD